MHPAIIESHSPECLDFNPSDETRQQFVGLSDSELESLILESYVGARERLFMIGDACLEFLARTGTSDRQARAQVIKDVQASTGVEFGVIWGCIRMAVAFPPSIRESYPDRTITWFRTLTDRSALPGETQEERLSNIKSLAAECAELSVSATRAKLEERRQEHMERRGIRKESIASSSAADSKPEPVDDLDPQLEYQVEQPTPVRDVASMIREKVEERLIGLAVAPATATRAAVEAAAAVEDVLAGATVYLA